jgi:PEP-CTERM motif
MMRKVLVSFILLILTAAFQPSAARAGFEGKMLRLEDLYQGSPYPGYTVDFVVDSAPGAVEVPQWGGSGRSIDVYDTGPNTASVLFTENVNYGGNFSPSPNILYFQSLDSSIPAIASVVIGDASPTLDDPSRVSFTSTTFGYDLGGLPQGLDHLRLDVVFETVPEPTSVALLGCGILGIVAASRCYGPRR